MGTLLDKKKPPQETNIRNPIRKITFSTFVSQTLNSNNEFIKLLNDFVPQLDHKMFTSFENMKQTCKIIFNEIVSDTLETILHIDNLPELIQDNIIPTDAFIIGVIVDLIFDQYNTNNFFVTHFPKLNLDLVQPCHYDKELYNISCRPWFDKFYQFYFNNFCNQTSIDILPIEHEYKYLNYSYNIDKSTFNYISHYTPNDFETFDPQHIGCPFMISFTKGVITFEVLNHNYIYRIIKESEYKGNRFTFFPLCYIVPGNDGHACFIVFDNVFKTVFLLDPNGTTNYLSKYINSDNKQNDDNSDVSLPYMIDAFSSYVNIFNQWNSTPNETVNFEFHCEMNSININYLTEYSYNYDNGHCQPLILLLVHLLYMHQDIFSDNVPSDLNLLLKNLDLRSLIRIKYNFSSNLLRIAHDNKILDLSLNKLFEV